MTDPDATVPAAPAIPATDTLAGLDPAGLLRQGIDPAASTAPVPAQRWQAPDPATLSALLPQLEVVELVGQGGMGAVYRAVQRHLDRTVALKILPRELGADPDFAARFAREAKALARLNHPNLVTIHDYGQTDGWCWLVMEFVDGANLRQVMRTGRLSPQQALAVVPQLCDALQYAHDEGVVHRDIKPENILMDARGRVKIADFGLAKLRGEITAGDALTGSGAVLGTVHYMAPEQVEGAKDVDHRADIYSLGVVFYEMLTGGLPLGRFEPPSRRIRLDVRFDEVVLKALEKDPARRYQQASEVQSAVEGAQAATPQPTPAPKADPADGDEDGLRLGRSFRISTNALVVLAVMACVLAATFTPDGPTSPPDTPTKPAATIHSPDTGSPPAPPPWRCSGMGTHTFTGITNLPQERIFVANLHLRTTDVEGDCTIRMWVQFSDGSRYFSARVLEGSASGHGLWRTVPLPFDASASNNPIAGIDFDVHLAGRGTVEVMTPVPIEDQSASVKPSAR